MSQLDSILKAGETVLWRGKPAKKPFLLWSLGGIPFGAFFLVPFFAWASGVSIMQTLPIPLAVMLAGWGFGLIVVPPVWRLKNYPNTEYVITNQRLIIQTWAFRKKIWRANFSEIKGVGVRKEFLDRRLGTGTVYPITPTYPFPPGMRFNYTEGNPYRTHKLYNPATGEYEEFTEMQIWRKVIARPCLQFLNEPYEVQKLLQREIEKIQIFDRQTKPFKSGSDQPPSNAQFPTVDSSKKNDSTKQKTALVLGLSLLLSGMSAYAYAYFTHYVPYFRVSSSYTFIDYVAIFGFGVGWLGLVMLFFVFAQRFSKWARKPEQ